MIPEICIFCKSYLKKYYFFRENTHSVVFKEQHSFHYQRYESICLLTALFIKRVFFEKRRWKLDDYFLGYSKIVSLDSNFVIGYTENIVCWQLWFSWFFYRLNAYKEITLADEKIAKTQK